MSLLAPETIELGMLPAMAFVDRSKLPNVAALYFVLDAKDIILYIGKATSLCFRWASHHLAQKLTGIPDTRIAWCAVDDARDLPHLEKACISYFAPAFNGRKGRSKPSEAKVTTVLRIPKPLYDACVVYAEKDHRSINGLLVKVIEDWMRTVENKAFLSLPVPAAPTHQPPLAVSAADD